MPLKQVRYKGYDNKWEISTVDELLEKAKADPWFPHPYPILKSMLTDKARPTEGVSVTSLLKGCPRCRILEKEVDYVEDLDAMWSRWRGTMYHNVLEAYQQDGAIVEVRFYMTMPNGAELHGQPDLILPEHGALVDLKTTKNIPKWDKVWDDHNAQLQTYRYLINHAERMQHGDEIVAADPEVTGLTFSTVGIWYCDDEGYKPLEARISRDVPTKAGAKNETKKVRLPDLWSDEKVESFIVPRIDAYLSDVQRYQATGRLPAMPVEDPMPQSFWPHRYSPVAYLCLDAYYKEGR